MLSPSRSWLLKKFQARSIWFLLITFIAKTPVSLMWAWAVESALTPTTMGGGPKEACVTQFTVAAPTLRPSALLLVSTNMP